MRCPSKGNALLAVGLVFLSAGVLKPLAVHATGNTCSPGNVCVAFVGAGSIVYGFATNTNDSNYSNDFFSNGQVVANQTGQGRSRGSWANACFYTGTSFAGTSSIVPNNGVWKNISWSSESHWLHSQSVCT